MKNSGNHKGLILEDSAPFNDDVSLQMLIGFGDRRMTHRPSLSLVNIQV
jgi:hypothetical protein